MQNCWWFILVYSFPVCAWMCFAIEKQRQSEWVNKGCDLYKPNWQFEYAWSILKMEISKKIKSCTFSFTSLNAIGKLINSNEIAHLWFWWIFLSISSYRIDERCCCSTLADIISRYVNILEYLLHALAYIPTPKIQQIQLIRLNI